MKAFSRFLMVLALFSFVPTLRGDELDDLALPPLPGEGDELDLPPLPGDKAVTPAPKPPPPPPPAHSKSLEPLDLPPLPGEEASPRPKLSQEKADPLEGLDLPELPGEKAAPTKTAVPTPEPDLLKDLDLPGLSEEPLVTPAPVVVKEEEPVEETVVETPAPVHHAKPARHAKVSEKPKAKPAPEKKREESLVVAKAPAQASGPRVLPLPGMDFWNAGFLGSRAPRGDRAMLIYFLLSVVIPLGANPKLARGFAALLALFKKKT